MSDNQIKLKDCPYCNYPNHSKADKCKLCETPLNGKEEQTLKAIAKKRKDESQLQFLQKYLIYFGKIQINKKVLNKLSKKNLVNILGIVVICGGLYLWADLIAASQSSIFTSKSEKSLVEEDLETQDEPSIIFTEKIASIKNVPEGIYTYSGEGYFSPLLSYGLLDEISVSFENFKIEYTIPFNQNPSYYIAIEMLLQGEVDFVFNGRALNPAEYAKANRENLVLHSQAIALDGIVFFYSEDVGVSELSIVDLQRIFQGELTNWQQLGGRDLPIIPVLLAKENLNDLGFTVSDREARVKYVSSHILGVREIINTPGAFGYASASLLQNQSMLSYFALGQADRNTPQQIKYVSPFKEGRINFKAFADGSYPLTRKLFVVFSNRRRSFLAGNAIVNAILSKQGQEFLERAGFVNIVH